LNSLESEFFNTPYIKNLNTFLGSYIAEPARRQSRALSENWILLQLTRAMRRISRNMLLQEADERFDPHIGLIYFGSTTIGTP
jgi:hypothetical protein